MASRQLLLVASLFLLMTAVVTALSPRQERGTETTATTPAVAAPRTPAPEVTGTLPSREPVEAQVGDVVVLTVRSAAADVAEIPPLAIDADVLPDLPARMEFVADRPGRFPVRLRQAERHVGTLVVTAQP